MSVRSGQPLLKTNAVLSSGLASAAAALLTSRFGLAGTLLGAATTSMIITGGSALVGFYMDRAATKARDIPPKVQDRLARPRGGPATESSTQDSPSRFGFLRNLFGQPGSSQGRFRKGVFRKGGFRKYSKARWRGIYGVLAGAAVSFLIGLIVITGLEFGAGKSLSCWVWDRCPEPIATTPASYAHPLNTETRATIFGGGTAVGENVQGTFGGGAANGDPPLHDGGAADQYGPSTPQSTPALAPDQR